MDISTAQYNNKIMPLANALILVLAAWVGLTVASFAQAAPSSVTAEVTTPIHVDHTDHSKIHTAQPYYKPGAPVRLLSPFQYNLNPNDELSVTLDLGVPASGTVDIALLTDEGGLSILSPQNLTLEANKQLHVPVTLRAGVTPSLAFLRLHIRYTSSAGQISTRALAVAFDSRSEQTKTQLKTRKMPDVISMPATESIY